MLPENLQQPWLEALQIFFHDRSPSMQTECQYCSVGQGPGAEAMPGLLYTLGQKCLILIDSGIQGAQKFLCTIPSIYTISLPKIQSSLTM
jgi:hypothetical protein